VPYITQAKRSPLNLHVEALSGLISTPGDLNYVIYRLLLRLTVKERTYHELSRWRAAVIDCSDEFYRREMGPYENGARERNGDVYP
jgi:hypothetical protein